MLAFDDIKPGTRLRGLDPAGIAEVVQVARFGAGALNLVFRANGRVGERLVYRGEEASLELVEGGRRFAFKADDALLRLASEAYASISPTCTMHTRPERLPDQGLAEALHHQHARDKPERMRERIAVCAYE